MAIKIDNDKYRKKATYIVIITGGIHDTIVNSWYTGICKLGPARSIAQFGLAGDGIPSL